MTFDPMRGPPALAQGTGGTIRIGGLAAGTLGAWRVVSSPTTGKPTLMGEGRFLRYYGQAVGAQVHVRLTPRPQPARIGRPKPKAARPFTLTGKLVEYSPSRITIAEGEIARG